MDNLIRSSLDTLFVLTQPKNELVSTEFLSLVIAFFAVVFSPLVQIMISKRQLKVQTESLDKQLEAQIESLEKQLGHQLISIDKQIRSTVLSKNRQDWINSLRDNVSMFISSGFALLLMTKKTQYNEIRAKIEELLQYSSKIKLLINPKEDDHANLVLKVDQVVYQVIGEFTAKNGNDKQGVEIAKTLINELIILSQIIFKREWERVKTLE